MRIRLTILIIFLYTCVDVCSQDLKSDDFSKLRESLQLFTNQELYLSGDEILVSVRCKVESLDKPISKVVYVELVNKNGIPRIQQAIAIKNGVANARLYLPSTFESGDYVLVAHTKWSRNYGNHLLPQKNLKIINAFAKISRDIFISDSLTQSPNSASKLLQTDKDIYVPRDTVKLPLDSLASKNYIFDLLVQKKSPGVKGAGNKEQTDPSVAIEPTNIIVPDYRGYLISGRVQNKSGQGIPGVLLSITFPEDQLVRFVTSNEKGRFHIYSEEVISSKALEILPQNEKSKDLKIILDNPFLDDYSFLNQAILKIDSTAEKYILDRSIELQLINAYYEALEVENNSDKAEGLNGLTPKIYNLDEYTRFPLLEDPVIEFVHELRIRRAGEYTAFTMPYHTSPQGVDSVLAMLDNVPIYPAKILEENSGFFETIELYMEPFTINGVDFKGAVNFTTFEKHKEKINSGSIPIASTNVSPRGSDIPGPVQNDRIPDLRNQLYWESNLSINKEAIRFIASDSPGEYEVILKGFDDKGKNVLTEYAYFVIED